MRQKVAQEFLPITFRCQPMGGYFLEKEERHEQTTRLSGHVGTNSAGNG